MRPIKRLLSRQETLLAMEVERTAQFKVHFCGGIDNIWCYEDIGGKEKYV